MDTYELSEALAELKAELGKIEPADENARERLKKLDGEIHRVLGASGDLAPEHGHGLRESLEDSAVYYEASHPALGVLMSRVLKALSDMGI